MADDLQRLADLHSAGQLTDDEYERAKAAVIAGVREAPVVTTATWTAAPAPPPEPAAPAEPQTLAARVKGFAVFVALCAGVLAFLSAIPLTAAVPSLAKLAGPVLCTGSHGYATVDTHSYNPEPGKTVRTLDLLCVDRATGDVHQPGTLLTILVLFVEEAVLWFLLITVAWWLYLGVQKLRGGAPAPAT